MSKKNSHAEAIRAMSELDPEVREAIAQLVESGSTKAQGQIIENALRREILAKEAEARGDKTTADAILDPITVYNYQKPGFDSHEFDLRKKIAKDLEAKGDKAGATAVAEKTWYAAEVALQYEAILKPGHHHQWGNHDTKPPEAFEQQVGKILGRRIPKEELDKILRDLHRNEYSGGPPSDTIEGYILDENFRLENALKAAIKDAIHPIATPDTQVKNGLSTQKKR